MKFANLVAVSSIQRIQTGGLLFAVFFSMSWPVHLFLEFGKARSSADRFLLLDSQSVACQHAAET